MIAARGSQSSSCGSSGPTNQTTPHSSWTPMKLMNQRRMLDWPSSAATAAARCRCAGSARGLRPWCSARPGRRRPGPRRSAGRPRRSAWQARRAPPARARWRARNWRGSCTVRIALVVGVAEHAHRPGLGLQRVRRSGPATAPRSAASVAFGCGNKCAAGMRRIVADGVATTASSLRGDLGGQRGAQPVGRTRRRRFRRRRRRAHRAAGGRSAASSAGGAASAASRMRVRPGVQPVQHPDEPAGHGGERDAERRPRPGSASASAGMARPRPPSARTASAGGPQLAGDQRVGLLADAVHPLGAVRRVRGTAHEAERHAEIHQLAARPGAWPGRRACSRSWSKKPSPPPSSWWKVAASVRCFQRPCAPQGVFSTTSSRLAQSA